MCLFAYNSYLLRCLFIVSLGLSTQCYAVPRNSSGQVPHHGRRHASVMSDASKYDIPDEMRKSRGSITASKGSLFASRGVFVATSLLPLFSFDGGMTFRSDANYDEVTVCVGRPFGLPQGQPTGTNYFACPSAIAYTPPSYATLLAEGLNEEVYCCGSASVNLQHCCRLDEFAIDKGYSNLSKSVTAVMIAIIVVCTIGGVACCVGVGVCIYCIFQSQQRRSGPAPWAYRPNIPPPIPPPPTYMHGGPMAPTG